MQPWKHLIQPDDIEIISPEGETRCRVKGYYGGTMFTIDDMSVDVQAGDEIRRALPNGKEETFLVQDPKFFRDGHFGSHYQVKVSRRGSFAPRTGGNYNIHMHGTGARVNVSSTDNSTNVINEARVFADMRAAFADGVTDVELRKALGESEFARACEHQRILSRWLSEIDFTGCGPHDIAGAISAGSESTSLEFRVLAQHDDHGTAAAGIEMGVEAVTPWHFTTWLDLADHWQGLIAGILGFGAAIAAVVLTLRSERRKADRDLTALRRSIGVEIRQSAAVALGTFQSLTKLAQKDDGPITLRMVQSLAHFQDPVIFPAVADKIGLLGSQAMEVVIFYNLIDNVRRGVARLANYRTPDDITPGVVAGTANCLVPALRQGCCVIAALKTNEPTTDERDTKLAADIARDTAAWQAIRTVKWPELH